MDYQKIVPNIIGLVGVSLVVLAYLQLQTHRWKASDRIFPLTNLVGALCILVSLLFNWNLSSVVIEFIWISISCYGLFRLKFRPEQPQAPFHDFSPIPAEEMLTLLNGLEDDWQLTADKHLTKTWVFDSYQKSIDFVNQAVAIAEKVNHHPVFLIEYKKVTLTLWTHNTGSLTKADYDLAKELSNI